MLRFVNLLLAFTTFTQSQDCNLQIAPYGQVCVCNATYCDTVPRLEVSSGNYQVYSSRKSKLGFYSKTGSFMTNDKRTSNTINLNQSIKYQTIFGFGGAFTDATGINIASLPAATQQELLKSYFSKSGIEYSLGRVPIAGTDFSTRAYTYDDNFDPLLLNFTLQTEDISYKIPYIQEAIKLNNKIKLFASPWTAPPWMKTNNDWTGVGVLKEEFYQVYANYIIKFLDKYQANNITFWRMTPQNEPANGFVSKSILYVNSMGWTPEMTRFWINNHLGPTLKNSTHRDVKIILHDDQRLTVPLLKPLLNDKVTMEYADGVGIHWYLDRYVPASILDTIKSPFQDVFILATEACNGPNTSVHIEKGSWNRGAKYAKSILENLQHGAVGWVDWNMVLDETGGPVYTHNNVDSPVLVNSTLQEFYKQPMFYVMGHFSKFIVPGSVRIKTTLSSSITSDLNVMAFLRPDHLTALVIFNNGMSDITVQVQDRNNQIAILNIEKYSINTLLYK